MKSLPNKQIVLTNKQEKCHKLDKEHKQEIYRNSTSGQWACESDAQPY